MLASTDWGAIATGLAGASTFIIAIVGGVITLVFRLGRIESKINDLANDIEDLKKR